MTAVTMPVEEEVMPAASPETDPLLGTYKRAPMEFVKGEGVELIDSDGKRYLDFASGIAVNALGYGDAGIARVNRRGVEHRTHSHLESLPDIAGRAARDQARRSFLCIQSFLL